jgi:uncharacterized protein DUF6883
MKRPNGDRADIGTKLEDYALNFRHWEGRHKARVFESMLGITLANGDVLRQAILRQPRTRTTLRVSETTAMAKFTSCAFRWKRRKGMRSF